jgi:DNA-binding MarR family transcriptional regulator
MVSSLASAMSATARRSVVTLTSAGTGALKRLDKRIEAAQAALLAPLSTSDRRELCRRLEQLVGRA